MSEPLHPRQILSNLLHSEPDVARQDRSLDAEGAMQVARALERFNRMAGLPSYGEGAPLAVRCVLAADAAMEKRP